MVLTPPRPLARTQRGMTLVEVLLAAAVGALLLGALVQVAHLDTQARAPLRDTGEALYQAKFALQRMAAAAAATAPAALPPPPAKSSGSWFGTVMFCVNAAGSLIETTPTDTGCAGSTVIAERVSAFSVAVPATAGASDGEVAEVSLSLAGPGGGGATTLSERMRLGGGLK
jgi:prepilin-type N-terminal cleavage/methylation domain-containing protein